MSDAFDKVMLVHPAHKKNKKSWKFQYDSYIGGDEYKAGNYLFQYQQESAGEYAERIRVTPIDNQCDSVISIYNGFLFRESPTRDLGTLQNLPDIEDFVEDTDYDGRNIDAFMKEVATWSSVYGHCFVLVVKPNISAVTRADELAAGVRPYAVILSPLAVLDWKFERTPSGKYELVYFKYVEDIDGTVATIKEWYVDVINTYTVETEKEIVMDSMAEPNGLGRIPVVTAYNKRSTAARGIGVSDIRDIATVQQMIYNLHSETHQSVYYDSHKSLAKTKDTKAETGAGFFIELPDNLDPGLKPYYVESNPANISSYLEIKRDLVSSIEKMANIGNLRSTEAQRSSGAAQQQEFELLNARLSDKANNLKLAEEQIWKLIALYMGKEWNGQIDYPDSFNIKDVDSEVNRLKTAIDATQDPSRRALLEQELQVALGMDVEVLGIQNNTDTQN